MDIGWIKRIFLTISLALQVVSSAYASFSSGADHIINQVSPMMNIGVEVIDLTTGNVLYRRNAHKLFIPASNMKLFSDAAALMVLGPDYRFRNDLSIGAAELDQGDLKGNLYLRLPGDPSFTHERLNELLLSLQKMHIKHIHGDVIIDSDHALVSPYAPGGVLKDRAYSYGAPLAPLMLDTNRTLITVNPAEKSGLPAIVELAISQGNIPMKNAVTTRARATHCGVSFLMDNNTGELTVRGCVVVGQWAIQQAMAIRNPLAYAQQVIKNTLHEMSIVLDGQVILGKTPHGSMRLATDYSKPIAQLMADTLKPSDNLYADSLFLHTAAVLNGAPLNWLQSQQIVKKFLEKQTGISLTQAVLIDGSGLSRMDRLTTEQTVGLLRFLYDHFPLAYEYIAALPISGRDGTLQKRFKLPEQKDLVRAKTGTMAGIVSLSGYLYTANGHTLAFAMFANTLRGTKPSVAGSNRYVIDALASYFLKQKPGNNVWTQFFAAKTKIKYQQNPTQAEIKRNQQARWRQLEIVVKRALQDQNVSVIFRGNELILRDNQANPAVVLNILKNLHKKYRFSAGVVAHEKMLLDADPLVLWRSFSNAPTDIMPAKRFWMLHESSNSNYN